MNRHETVNLLTLIQLSDNRTIGETEIMYWHGMLERYDERDCCEAVLVHRREQPGVWLEPGHVVQRVKAMRRDRYERADPNIRDTPYGELGGNVGDKPAVRRDRYGMVDKSAPEIEYDDAWTADQRLGHYWPYVRALNPEYAGLKHRPATAAARDAAMREISKTLSTMLADTPRSAT